MADSQDACSTTALAVSSDNMTLRGQAPARNLLQLPREIRDMIYAYYATANHPIKNVRSAWSITPAKVPSQSMALSLRATCRQARAEIAADAVFNDSVFFFSSWEDLYLYSANRNYPVPPIRHLDIDLDGPDPHTQTMHRDSWRNLQFLRSCHSTGWRPILETLETLRLRTSYTDCSDNTLVWLLRECLMLHISWDFYIREMTPTYPRLREMSISGLVCAASDKDTALRQLADCDVVRTVCMLLQLAPVAVVAGQPAPARGRLRSTVDADTQPGGLYTATYDPLSDTWTILVRNMNLHPKDGTAKGVLHDVPHPITRRASYARDASS